MGINQGYGLGTSLTLGGGGKQSGTKSVIQSLVSGNNTVTHSLGASYTVSGIGVFDSTGKIFYQTEFDIIDSNSINVILSGGSIANAIIRINYF